MRAIDPELPWGCWLRIDRRFSGDVYVDDATGLEFPTLRAALWNGRLGMPSHLGEPPSGLLETIHAILAATVRRHPSPREEIADVFPNGENAWTLLSLWLASTGLAVLGEGARGVAALTDEGWAVLHLLAATRPYDVRQSRPSAATIRALTELGMGPEDRDERFARLEREALRWDAAFLRGTEGHKPTILLSKRGDGPVPVKRTVWSMSFPTKRKRDVFYDWLCLRLDRWQAWAELACSYGSQKLTHKLLEVMASALEDDGPPAIDDAPAAA